MNAPQFPPLFRGDALTGKADPLSRAIQLATAGTDAGLVVYNVSAEQLRAAIVFAPEVPLEEALAVIPASGIGFQNALGALAPPEVAVHLEWPGAIRVNGAICGNLTARASTVDSATEPDWLIVGLSIDMAFHDENPGDNPEKTALIEEGCAEVEALSLLEGWVRHTLYWINRWTDEGTKPLHTEWQALAHDLGEEVDWGFKRGTFVGMDEHFGALLRQGTSTELLSLSTLLES